MSVFEVGPPSVWPTNGAFLDGKALHTDIARADLVAVGRCHWRISSTGVRCSPWRRPAAGDSGHVNTATDLAGQPNERVVTCLAQIEAYPLTVSDLLQLEILQMAGTQWLDCWPRERAYDGSSTRRPTGVDQGWELSRSLPPHLFRPPKEIGEPDSGCRRVSGITAGQARQRWRSGSSNILQRPRAQVISAAPQSPSAWKRRNTWSARRHAQHATPDLGRFTLRLGAVRSAI